MNIKPILCSIGAAAVILTGMGVYKGLHQKAVSEPTPLRNPYLCRAILPPRDLLEEGQTPLGQGLKKLADDSLDAAHLENLRAAIEQNIRTMQAECPRMFRDFMSTSKANMAQASLTIYGGTRQPSDAEIKSVCSDPDRAAMVQARWLELQKQGCSK